MRSLILKISTEDKSNYIIIASPTKIDVGVGDRANLSDIADWGIYSTTGVVEFIDQDNAFKNFLVGKNVKDLIVETINVEGGIDVSKFSDNIVSTLKVADYDYDKQTKTYSLELYDGLTDWQDYDMPEMFYYNEMTAYNLLTRINATAKDLGYIKSYIVCDSNTQNILQSLTIFCPRIRENNLWSIFTEFCELTMCRIFCSNFGTVYISHKEYATLSKYAVLRAYNVLNIGDNQKQEKTAIQNASITTKNIKKIEDGDLFPPITIPLYDIGLYAASDTTVGFSASWSDYSNGDLITKLSEQDINISASSSFTLSGFIKFNENTNPFYLKNPEIKISVKEKKQFYSNREVKYIFTNYYNHIYAGYYFESGNSSGIPIVPDVPNNRIYINWNSADKFPYDNQSMGTPINGYIRAFTEATISSKGKYYKENEDITYTTYSESYAKPKPLASNELIQAQNTWYDGNYAQYVLDTIDDYYGKGIECVEMLCTISEYYDEQGNFVTNVFNLYDTVTPYIVLNNQEQPYSTYEDGLPKQFTVVGVRYIDEGRAKQKLYLQEIPLITI